MTRSFVSCFSTLHFERKCITGVYVCTACRDALTTLNKLRVALKRDPQGRWAILNNSSFMKLLLKLCDTDSTAGPKICTVNGRDVRWFYERGQHRSLKGRVEMLQDEEACIKRWKLFLGKAVEKIKPLSCIVTFSPPSEARKIPGGAATAWMSDRQNCDHEAPDSLLGKAKEKRAPAGTLSKLDVVGSLDDQHLWVYCGPEVRKGVRLLSQALMEFLGSLEEDGVLDRAPAVGSIAGLKSSSDQVRRALVLQVNGSAADVWAMDYGDVYQVPWSGLLDLPPSFKCIPPQVSLCILKDVPAAPYLNLLKGCIRTLSCITWHHRSEVLLHANMARRMLHLGGFEVLCGLVSCPDYDTRILAVDCLLQCCHHHCGRFAVAESGCIMAVLSRLKKLLTKRHSDSYVIHTIEKQHLVNLLQAIFLHNEELVSQYADSELLQVLTKIQKSTSPNTVLYGAVDHCLQTVLGPAYTERRWVFEQRGVAPKCREVTVNPASARTPSRDQRFEIRPHSPPAKSRHCITEKPSCGCQGRPGPSSHFYLRRTLVDFGCDDTHELRPVTNMRLASLRTLAKVVCSFLNTWRTCTIYYGITRDSLVQGVFLNHAERDALRLGIDSMVNYLRPRLVPSSIAVEFVPVLQHAQEVSVGSPKYVVEVRVCGVQQTMYTTSDGMCYLRQGSLTYEATANDVRSWIAKQEEARYLAKECGTGREATEEPPTVHPCQGPASAATRTWDKVVY
ncbi:unnamed protein product [Ixodes hexagonus]